LEVTEKFGLSPNLIIGDMDSIRDKTILDKYSVGKIRRYSHEKDETDTEIALRKAFDMGCGKIAVIGGGGGRIDHIFALLNLFEREKRPSIWITHRDVILDVEAETIIDTSPGELVSFFPAGPEPAEMVSEGLKWPLDRLCWTKGTFGISNEAVSGKVKIVMKSGRLIMVRQIKGEGDG
jgi:thiamine pyrophosphokinase